MDPVDLARAERTNSLVDDIRREIRTGNALTLIGLFAFMCFLIALEYGVVEGNDMVFLLLAAIFLSSFRFRQREKLLQKAADALDSKAR
ncbi:MAG TPA: hypothetical protein VF254_11280 [Gammaproteobacteria bacterium]